MHSPQSLLCHSLSRLSTLMLFLCCFLADVVGYSLLYQHLRLGEKRAIAL
ncbi:hypothetical protein NC997_05885 [Trichocoleus sp. DQ-A2]|nr:hypothetical protein [Coleofasciculus sp. FACHB-T130]